LKHTNRIRVIVVPEIEYTTTFAIDWFGEDSVRHGWVNLFEKGILLYKAVWK
jgi:hypothetical protein